MILVLASRFDEATGAAVTALQASADVALLTVDDLLTAGWIVPAEDPQGGKFVAEGRVHAATEISGVINLMTCVYDFEMLSIRREDRSYVAAELFAFVTWWLSVLRCPVLNRPTAGSLNGPAWGRHEWLRACRRADVPMREGTDERWEGEGVGHFPRDKICSTIVARKRSYGGVYAKECAALAALAGTDFLEVFFADDGGGWLFNGVRLLPGIHRAEVRDILTNSLAGP